MRVKKGSTSKQIMLRAAKALFQSMVAEGIGSTAPYRDDFITWNDINNIKKTIDKETWRRHDDDMMSTLLWMQSNPHEVLLYQEPASTLHLHHYSLVIQREFQLDWLIKYGNGRCIAIDGTTNTQIYKVMSLKLSQYVLIVLGELILRLLYYDNQINALCIIACKFVIVCSNCWTVVAQY